MTATIQDVKARIEHAEANRDNLIEDLLEARAAGACEQIELHLSDPSRYCVHGKDLNGNWWSSRGNLCAMCDRGYKNDEREHRYFINMAFTGAIKDGTAYIQGKGRTRHTADGSTIDVTPQDILDDINRRIIPSV